MYQEMYLHTTLLKQDRYIGKALHNQWKKLRAPLIFTPPDDRKVVRKLSISVFLSVTTKQQVSI